MNIALFYTHHRRCGPWYYKRALQVLRHNVISMGPWKEDEPWGTRGRGPDTQLYGTGLDVGYVVSELNPAPDMLWVIDGGEGLRVSNVPANFPWVHISTEGAAMEWSRGRTPFRYAEIMCNGADEDVRWLPKAFESAVQHPNWSPASREYDLVMLASARQSRVDLWNEVRRRAPDLHCLFGDIWGPLYPQAYAHSLATYTCSTLDFVTTRVFEAMALGCTVIADRTPSMRQLFTEDLHWIGYDPVMRPDGEGAPDPDWLISRVRELRGASSLYIARNAHAEVMSKHSYTHRVLRVLRDMSSRQ